MGGDTTNDQTRDDMWMSALFFFFTDCYNTLSHASACAQRMSAQCARKKACEGVLFTPCVG